MSILDYIFSLVEKKSNEVKAQQAKCSRYDDKRLFHEMKSGDVTRKMVAAQELKQRGYGQKKK